MSNVVSPRLWKAVLLVLSVGSACGPDSIDDQVDPPDLPPPPTPAGAEAGSGGVAPGKCAGIAGSFAASGLAAVAGGVAPAPLFAVATMSSEHAPPPISGGTMLATHDGTQVVAADPDRDLVYFVDAVGFALSDTRKLNPGDEPGRLVEDAAGRIHVVLRGSGAVASMSRDSSTPIVRRDVCDQPRGIAYDATDDSLQVACAEGKLVTLPAAVDATVERSVDIARDARDVVMHDDRLFVSQFRSAELHDVDASGHMQQRFVPPTFSQPRFQTLPSFCTVDGDVASAEPAFSDSTPTIAWRVIDVPGHGVAMLHQRARTDEIQVTSGGYGSGSCGSGIVQTSLTVGLESGEPVSVDLGDASVAVDVATDPDGVMLALAVPGNWGQSSQVQVFNMAGPTPLSRASNSNATPASGASDAPVAGSPSLGFGPDSSCVFMDRGLEQPEGQITAVTFASAYMLAAQAREPAGITFIDTRTGTIRARVDLKQTSRFDTGHTMFHVRAGAGVACASCHAEAGDDGHTWAFHDIGARRTQSLRGGILGTEPFHWNGDMQDFPTLVREVFVGRMAGFMPNTEQTDALAHWIDRQPKLHVEAGDASAAQRGQTLFESEAVGCAGCHNGEHFTNNQMAEVGTGATLQVPSLQGVSFRTPLMHDGCAATIADRFGNCGGGDKHGHTSQLSSAQIDDLIAYLETL